MKLLIVDDHPPNRRLLRAQLEAERHAALEASNGFEALKVLDDEVVDGVISDILMPEMDGFRLCMEVRQVPRFAAMPFVFYTSTYDSPQDRKLAEAVGADSYITKPAPLNILLDAINSAKSSSRAAVIQGGLDNEIHVLKQYNSALVRKLEERNIELESVVRQLRMAAVSARESEEKLRLFVLHAPAAIAMLDAECRYIAVSNRWFTDYGLGQADLTGKSHYDVFPELPEEWRRVHQRCLRGSVEMSEGEPFIRPDGRIDWIKWEIHPWRRLEGDVEGIVIFSEVITARKVAEEKVARLNRVRRLMGSMTSLLLRFRSRDELFAEACHIATSQGGFGIAWIGGYDTSTMRVAPVAWAGVDGVEIGELAEVFEGGTAIRPASMMKLFIDHQPVVYRDISNPPPGGAKRTAAIRMGYRSLVILPLVVDGNLVASFSLYAKEPDFFNDRELRLLHDLAGDISFALQFLANTDKANYLAYYDPLTSLPNRTLFLEHLTRALGSASESPGQLVLALGDVKRFRNVNETLGRPKGDELLKQLTARMLKLSRRPENLARVSGNTFATFLPGELDLADVAHRIERLMDGIVKEPFSVDGQEVILSFSVGLAVYPTDGNNVETLFRNAEAALMKAKQKNERFVFYSPDMNSRIAEALAMESRLRRALENEEFVLHYQPKVSVDIHRVTGLEALIRWQDPQLGLIPPGKFIAVMEETGLIVEAGSWALRQAVRDYRRWVENGVHPPRIAVNVSPRQLRQPGFINSLLDAVDDFGNLDVALDIEVTESVVIEDLKETVKKLQIVRGLGVEIAIDDFGTGYSSLGYVAQLPINALKIDRSFVIEMANNEYCRNIVKLIISLAHTLRLKVIAEGVDDPEHTDILKEMGCDEMQGFLISKPLPPAEVELFLRREDAPSW